MEIDDHAYCSPDCVHSVFKLSEQCHEGVNPYVPLTEETRSVKVFRIPCTTVLYWRCDECGDMQPIVNEVYLSAYVAGTYCTPACSRKVARRQQPGPDKILWDHVTEVPKNGS